MARWRRSGVTASEFARREGLGVGSLRWWSSALGRDTRASHGGSEAIEPIEIEVAPRDGFGSVEIAVGDATVRCDVGTSVEYVASLVRALGSV